MIITFDCRGGIWHAVYRMPHKNKVLLGFSDCRQLAFLECIKLIEDEWRTEEKKNHQGDNDG